MYVAPASTVALIGALCHEFRELLPVLDEHLTDQHGEMLPHLVMSDVVRWLVEHRENRARCEEVWQWLEAAMDCGDDDVRDLIGASGVEMIPNPGEPGSEFRAMLGPRLRAMDDWQI